MADSAEILSAGLNLTPEQQAILAANVATFEQNQRLRLAQDVAAAQDGTHLTRAGFELIGKCIAGQELQFTRVKLGDANGETPTEEEQYEMTDLINPKYAATLTEIRHTGGGTMAVSCLVENAHIQEGFFAWEMGLFAIDPDTGDEVLYCYRNSGMASDYIPATGGSVIINLIFTVITVIDKAQNITAVIDTSLIFVTQTEFIRHINSNNPHPNLPALAETVDVAYAVWVNGGDNKLHPMSMDNLSRQVLGGEASTIPKINARLTQTEINLANIYLEMKAKEDLGVDGNLIMIEPFTDNDCCDRYSCDVITAVAGVNNIQIDNDQYILVGAWYTITDGIYSEYVQVKSIARNGTQVVVILEDDLVNTYDLPNTKLLRTTAVIGEGQATGAGDVRTLAMSFGEVWIGTGGNVEQTLDLNTTQANSGNFTVTDDGTFTVDGFFTLTA